MLPPIRGTETTPLTLTDYSGTTPDTNSNTIIASNANRKYLLIQNLSDTAMYVNFGAAASAGAGSIKIAATGTTGDKHEWNGNGVPVSDVRLLCTASSKAYTVKEG